MNAMLNRIYPTATPAQLAAMQSDWNTSQMFQKKSEEWDEAHGLGYHLKTVALIVGLLPFCWPLALYFADTRRNPYKGAANSYFMRYEETRKQLIKPQTLKQLLAAAKATPAPTRPAQSRRRTHSATLAA